MIFDAMFRPRGLQACVPGPAKFFATSSPLDRMTRPNLEAGADGPSTPAWSCCRWGLSKDTALLSFPFRVPMSNPADRDWPFFRMRPRPAVPGPPGGEATSLPLPKEPGGSRTALFESFPRLVEHALCRAALFVSWPKPASVSPVSPSRERPVVLVFPHFTWSHAIPTLRFFLRSPGVVVLRFNHVIPRDMRPLARRRRGLSSVSSLAPGNFQSSSFLPLFLPGLSKLLRLVSLSMSISDPRP